MIWMHESKWSFSTSATGGVGIGPVAASGGLIRLTDPSGTDVDFYYGGLGGGVSGGFKIPKLKLPNIRIKGKAAGGAGSITQLPSGGYVFKTAEAELTMSDIQGGTVYIDVGAGIVAGGSASAMLFGLNTGLLLAGIANPLLLAAAIATASGALVMAGINVGPQFGWGAAGLVGYMR